MVDLQRLIFRNMNNFNVKSITLTHVLCQKTEVIDRNSFVPRIIVVVTHTLGFGASRRVSGLGLVKLRFHVTLGDAVTQ